MSEDVVATSGALEGEAKAGYHTDHIGKCDIPKIALRKFLEELSAIHLVIEGNFFALLLIGQDHFLEGIAEHGPAVFQIFPFGHHLGPFD